MRLDPASSLPVFEQVAGSVVSAIAAGVFRPGELIPSIRQQATDLLINPNTIKRAYEALERDGLIEPRAGLGMADGVLKLLPDAPPDSCVGPPRKRKPPRAP